MFLCHHKLSFWFGFLVILRTGAVVELRRSQGWRTREHISCLQSMDRWGWRSKMSRTSLVQAEWPVEFNRDFNIITRELSRATLLFSLVIIELSRTIKSLYKKSSNEILAVQDRFLNRFNRDPWRRLSAIRLRWKYQQANDNDAAVIAKKRREEESYWTNFF